MGRIDRIKERTRAEGIVTLQVALKHISAYMVNQPDIRLLILSILPILLSCLFI